MFTYYILRWYVNEMGNVYILHIKVICLHITLSCDFLVHQFFRIYSTWNWLEPIFLYYIEKKNEAFPVWDWERDFKHHRHKMPTISPAYPCNSVIFWVTPNTFRFLYKKLRRGHDKCKVICLHNNKYIIC